MDTMELRAAFRADAALAGPPPTDPFEAVVARRHASDRRRLAALSAALAAVMVAIAVPIGISLVEPPGGHVAGPSIPGINVFAGATRGSLAGDAPFLQALTELPWGIPAGDSLPADPSPPPATRHVAFAGDAAAGRWALVVGPNTDLPQGSGADPALQTDIGALSTVAGVWYTGPVGAAPDQMRAVTMSRGLAVDMPVSLYDPVAGVLVVLAAPGDFVEYSIRPGVAADASVTRQYIDTGTTDGLAVVTLAADPFAGVGIPALQWRVTRDAVVVAEQPPDVTGEALEPPTVPIEYLRSPAGALGPGDGAQMMSAQAVGEYGLDPADVLAQVHYVGSLPGSNATAASLTVLTVTLPSGAVLVRGDWLQSVGPPQGQGSGAGSGESFVGGRCADQLIPAGVPAARRTLAMTCEVVSGDEDGATQVSLAIITPVGGAAAYATVTVGASITRVELDAQGVGIVEAPPGAQTVVIHAADDSVLDEVPILSS